jgi:caffeoyl-CoA O-methyltransferase
MPRMPSRPMGVAVALCLTLAAAACTASAPSSDAPLSSSSPVDRRAGGVATRAELTPAIVELLESIRESDTDQLAVSEADGRFLRTLVLATGAQRVLEIGGASGYSAIWMGLGLRETGGSLVTIEYDPDRARALQANITAAGLDDVVRVIAGDAFAEIPALGGTFDMVFLDAWKPDYVKFLELTLPRLERGGVFVAHNVINKRDEMLDFLEAIERSPDLVTSIVSAGSEGLSVSVRR